MHEYCDTDIFAATPASVKWGGHTIVTGKLEVGSLGTAAHSRTVLTVGQVPMISDALRRLDQILELAGEELTRKTDRMESLAVDNVNLSAQERDWILHDNVVELYGL